MYLTDNIIKLSNKIGQRVYTIVSEMSIEAWITKNRSLLFIAVAALTRNSPLAQTGVNCLTVPDASLW